MVGNRAGDPPRGGAAALSRRPRQPRRWPRTPAAACELQRTLASEVIATDRFGPVRHVAGVDIAFRDGGKRTCAAVAVLSFPGLELAEWRLAYRPTSFPYVPGLLSFRETPAALAALDKLRIAPDLLLIDGHGFAHPRRFGIACHLGLLAGVPSIGVAKSRLIGSHSEPDTARGARTELSDHGELIGTVVRTRASTRPVFVSVGHRVGLESAVRLVLACTTRYRLPEPTRVADHLSKGRIPQARTSR